MSTSNSYLPTPEMPKDVEDTDASMKDVEGVGSSVKRSALFDDEGSERMISSLEVEGLGSFVFGKKLGAKLVSGKGVVLNSITYVGEVPINTRLLLSVMYFSRSFRQFKCFVFSTYMGMLKDKRK